MCDDGIDNDTDGRTDYNIDPAVGDPGCANASDTNERGRTPCDNGNDDDGDGIAMSHRQEAVNWFTENVHRLDVVSPRTLYEAANLLNRSRKARPRISASLASAMLDAKLTKSSNQPPPMSPTIPVKTRDD